MSFLSASKVNEKILLCCLIDICGYRPQTKFAKGMFSQVFNSFSNNSIFSLEAGRSREGALKGRNAATSHAPMVIAPDYVTSLSVCHYVRYKNQRAPVEVAAFGPCSVIFFVCPQRGVSVRGGGAVQRGFLTRGSLSRWGVSVQVRGLCPGGRSLSRWGGGFSVSVGGGSLSRGFSVQGSLCQGDPRRVTCGRYASYCNAFLLIYLFSIFTKYDTKLIKKNKNRRPFHHFP